MDSIPIFYHMNAIFTIVRTYLDVTKISIAHAVATSTGYAGRRPLPKLAGNVSRASVTRQCKIAVKVQVFEDFLQN